MANEPDTDAEVQRVARVRRAFTVASLVFLGLALWVFATGHVRISGRHAPAQVYTGAAAREWAAMFACTGIALLGPYLKTPIRMAVWMSLWLAAGIGTVLIPAFLPA